MHFFKKNERIRIFKKHTKLKKTLNHNDFHLNQNINETDVKSEYRDVNQQFIFEKKIHLDDRFFF